MQTATTQPHRITFTPESARRFERTSVGNALMVALAKSDCGCSAYEDVFTFNRWKAQGLAVKKGEHAIHLPLVRMAESEDEETGEVSSRKVLTSSAVFCRCQVAPVVERDPFRFQGKSKVKRENATVWPCGCKPYVDVLTRGRWSILGFRIRQGEGPEYHAGKRATIPVFCRCQLDTAESSAPISSGTETPDEIPF